MPVFTSNYPKTKSRKGILPTPQRVRALPDYTGKGVTIAFIDSGFAMHPDIAERVLIHVNAPTERIIEQPRVMCTDLMSWHGQMTSVIAAGDGSLSNNKYRGIASDSNLVLIKIGTPKYQVKEDDILRGLTWLVKNHARFNVKIANLSVGGDYVNLSPEHPIHQAVRTLVHAGITVVVAAGNSGKNSLVPPASAKDAITVGGYDDHNTMTRKNWTLYNNNYGIGTDSKPKPEIVAPAQWIASPILQGSRVEREARWLGPLLHDAKGAVERLLSEGRQDLQLSPQRISTPNLYAKLQAKINQHKLIDSHYQHVDGTSVAAPIVSSIVAQMLEAEPRLTPADIKHILIRTAKPLNGVPKKKQGAGAVNARKAVNMAKRYYYRPPK